MTMLMIQESGYMGTNIEDEMVHNFIVESVENQLDKRRDDKPLEL